MEFIGIILVLPVLYALYRIGCFIGRHEHDFSSPSGRCYLCGLNDESVTR